MNERLNPEFIEISKKNASVTAETCQFRQTAENIERQFLFLNQDDLNKLSKSRYSTLLVSQLAIIAIRARCQSALTEDNPKKAFLDLESAKALTSKIFDNTNINQALEDESSDLFQNSFYFLTEVALAKAKILELSSNFYTNYRKKLLLIRAYELLERKQLSHPDDIMIKPYLSLQTLLVGKKAGLIKPRSSELLNIFDQVLKSGEKEKIILAGLDLLSCFNNNQDICTDIYSKVAKNPDISYADLQRLQSLSEVMVKDKAIKQTAKYIYTNITIGKERKTKFFETLTF